jgi:antitoxin PrlF
VTSATLTSKGQITIPIQVRTALDLKAGDRIDFLAAGNGKVTLIARNQPIQKLKGMAGKLPRAISIEEMNEAIAVRGARQR